ncbi:MAG: hypothetical protein JW829_15200 [Pirellulales bacterium]|nr:hypothetical protein [Pirellulales bacterium]
MKTKRKIQLLFLAAAIYDGVLGAAFLVKSSALFQWFDVTPPNHMGYIQFPAALLIIFAVMFLAITANPARNRNLIPYGILLKVAYCGVVLYHWLSAGIPNMWKPFCIIDLAFLILFAWAWVAIPGMTAHHETNV